MGYHYKKKLTQDDRPTDYQGAMNEKTASHQSYCTAPGDRLEPGGTPDTDQRRRRFVARPRREDALALAR